MLKHFLAVHNNYDLFALDYVSILVELVKRAVERSSSYVECVCKIGERYGKTNGFFVERCEIECKTALGGSCGEVHDLFVEIANSIGHDTDVVVHDVLVVLEHLREGFLGDEEHTCATLGNNFGGEGIALAKELVTAERLAELYCVEKIVLAGIGREDRALSAKHYC